MRSHRKNTPVYFLFFSVLLLFILTVFIVYSFQVSYIFGVKITFSKIQRQCEPIHISMVIGGEETVLRAVTVFKSILTKTQHPIHFHFIADKVAKPILQTLFDSWKVPAVNVRLYTLNYFTNRVSWIPNIHYSGNFGLSKLLLAEILPADVERVEEANCDTLVLTDLFELWDRFHDMRPGEAIAMTENYSVWYTKRFIGKKWPAIVRNCLPAEELFQRHGFNSGVVLLNLHHLRKIHFDKLWRSVSKKYLASVGASLLADQDILNAVAYENPNMFHLLPPEYNVQLGPNSDQRRIGLITPKVLHWNNKNKSSPAFPEFTRLRKELENLDAMSFLLTRYECSTQQINVRRQRKQDPCDVFLPEQSYKTHLFIRSFKAKTSNSITVVTQISADRLAMLQSLIKSWEGPISVAIYATDSEMNGILQHIGRLFPNRDNLAIHGVHKHGNTYPINYLRNVALNASKTNHVLNLDGDFILGQGFSLAKSIDFWQNNSVLVIPAFEFRTTTYLNDLFSLTKKQLIDKLKTREVIPFRQDIWPSGHKETDFERWVKASEPFEVHWETNFEPYVLGRKEDIPLFSEKFGGFGWNKVTHSIQMTSIGLRFLVHPDAFVIHLPHPPSNELIKFRTDPSYRKCMQSFKKEFVVKILTRNSDN